MTPLEQLLALLKTRDWLPLVLLVTMIVRKWLSGESKFPVTIPKTWQPTVTAAGGLVYGAMLAIQGGQPIGLALLDMAAAAGAGGFLDGILVAIFDHDNAPVWARSIVFVFDDLTGRTPQHGAAAERVAKSIHPPPLPPVSTTLPSRPVSITQKPSEPPPKSTRTRAWGAFETFPIFASIMLLMAGIGNACSSKSVGPSTPADIGGVVACVIADATAGRAPFDCVEQYGPVLVNDVVPMLRHSKSFAAEHPEALPVLLSYKPVTP